MNKIPVLAVVGGGASGIFASINASLISNKKIKIVILERMDRIGKKILATGNGRCNFTNSNISLSNYHGKNSDFAQHCLNVFDNKKTISFFEKIGIISKEEQNGKIFPYSAQASSVLDVLRNEIEKLDIEILTNFEVKDIIKTKSGFKIISFKNENFYADKVIISSGGCASPNLGSNGTGFKFMKKLGHKIIEPIPALVQIKTDTDFVKSLKGIKFEGKASLFLEKKCICEQSGEILFADYTLSGPPIFQISVFTAQYKNCLIYLDFMPEYNKEEVLNIINSRVKKLSHLCMEDFFTGMLNKRIGNVIAKKSGIEKLSMPVTKLTDKNINSMVLYIKNMPVNVTGQNGWNNAQITAGGIDTNEINNKTMESKIINGLYLCGEIIDIFGDCGGFNLQWAWSSGYAAGTSAVKSIIKERLI